MCVLSFYLHAKQATVTKSEQRTVRWQLCMAGGVKLEKYENGVNYLLCKHVISMLALTPLGGTYIELHAKVRKFACPQSNHICS